MKWEILMHKQPQPAPVPADDVPRTLAAYGEGVPLPPLTTDEERDAFEGEQRRGWNDRSL